MVGNITVSVVNIASIVVVDDDEWGMKHGEVSRVGSLEVGWRDRVFGGAMSQKE